MQNGTILIRDGLIENVGSELNIPIDATIIDMTGKTIYAGFIDSWVEIPIISEYLVNHQAHWNSKIHARQEIAQIYDPDEKTINSLRKIGFTAAHIVPDSGIFKGQTALIQLDNQGTILQSCLGRS